RVVRIDLHGEAEIGRQALADVIPRIAGVVAAIYAPVMLQKHPRRVRRMRHHLVHALSPFRILLVGRHEARADTFVTWLPGFAAVVRAVNTTSRDRDIKAPRIRWIGKDRVETETA